MNKLTAEMRENHRLLKIMSEMYRRSLQYSKIFGNFSFNEIASPLKSQKSILRDFRLPPRSR